MQLATATRALAVVLGLASGSGYAAERPVYVHVPAGTSLPFTEDQLRDAVELRFPSVRALDPGATLTRGEDLESPQSFGPWLRVRMPAAYLDEAKASPRQRKIFSLERPADGVEVTLHSYDYCSEREVKGAIRATAMSNRVYVPGSPPRSGWAVVHARADGTFWSGLQLNGNESISWGFFGCSPVEEEDCPALSPTVLGADAGAPACR